MVSPKINLKNYSCVIIKPDGYQYRNEIIYEIRNNLKLKIPVLDKTYIIPKEKARLHYWKYRNDGIYRTIVEALSDKPTCRMFINGINALELIVERAGRYTNPKDSIEKEPQSWRARWGTDLPNNVVHRPTEPEELINDVRIHFSLMEILEKLNEDLVRHLYGLTNAN